MSYSVVLVSRSDFPQLASQGSWGSKNVSIKGNSPGLSRQKSGSGKLPEQSLSSSPASSQSLLKLKKDTMANSSGKDMLLILYFNSVNSVLACSSV